MSESTLLILNQKSATHLKDYQNGHGSAPVLWGLIAEKYFGADPYRVLDRDLNRQIYRGLAQYTPAEACALLLCCDFYYAPIKYGAYVADHLMEVGHEIEQKYPEKVNHWEAIGHTILETHNRGKFSRFAQGYVLNCTSVEDVYWHGADFSRAKSIFKEE